MERRKEKDEGGICITRPSTTQGEEGGREEEKEGREEGRKEGRKEKEKEGR